MLLFIPVSTDAPVYHFPAATIGLIVVNALAFVFTGFGDPEIMDPHILWFGAFRPMQWLTAFFLHASFNHLIGNMIFLWIFGLIVEGKLGWKKFLPLYLVIGICQCSFEQIIMLGADRDAAWRRQSQLRLEDEAEELFDFAEEGTMVPPMFRALPQEGGPLVLDELPPAVREAVMDALNEGKGQEEDPADGEGVADDEQGEPLMFGALGASGVIFSLMAMSLVWAPKNDITVFGWLFTRVFWFPLSVFWFALLFIGFDVLVLLLTGFRMSTAFLHVMGAVTGAAFGVVLFKTGAVDCEDWDLFSVLSGKYGPYARDRYGYRNSETLSAGRSDQDATKPKQSRIQRVSELIENEEYLTAAEALFNLRISQPRARLSETHLRELGTGLVAAQFYEEAELALEEYIEAYPNASNWARLRLSAIQLQENGQPNAAYDTLRGIIKENLTDDELAFARRLADAARKQIKAGVQDRGPGW